MMSTAVATCLFLAVYYYLDICCCILFQDVVKKPADKTKIEANSQAVRQKGCIEKPIADIRPEHIANPSTNKFAPSSQGSIPNSQLENNRPMKQPNSGAHVSKRPIANFKLPPPPKQQRRRAQRQQQQPQQPAGPQSQTFEISQTPKSSPPANTAPQSTAPQNFGPNVSQHPPQDLRVQTLMQQSSKQPLNQSSTMRTPECPKSSPGQPTGAAKPATLNHQAQRQQLSNPKQPLNQSSTMRTPECPRSNPSQPNVLAKQATPNHQAQRQQLPNPQQPINQSSTMRTPECPRSNPSQPTGLAKPATPNNQPQRQQLSNPQHPKPQNPNQQIGIPSKPPEIAPSKQLQSNPQQSNPQTAATQSTCPQGVRPQASSLQTKSRPKPLIAKRRAPGLAKPVKPSGETPAENGETTRQNLKESDNSPKRKVLCSRYGRELVIEPNTPVVLPGNSVNVQGTKNSSKAAETEKKCPLQSAPKIKTEFPAKKVNPAQQVKPVKPVMKDASTSTLTPNTSVDAAVQVPDEENAGDEIQSLLVKRPWDTERVMKMQVLLDEKLVVIGRIKEMSRKQRDELKSTKKRCSELETVIKASNMQGKPQLIAQVNELTDIKNELVAEVTNLTIELEKERTNVKGLKTELVEVRAQLTASRKKGANPTGQ